MLRRIWNVAKTVFLILGVVFILLLFLYAIVASVPKSTTPIDISLNMIKLDEKGNEIGTVPVTIRGNIKKYWFHEDQLDVIISPFESYTEFKPGSMNNTPGGLVDLYGTMYTVYHGKGPNGYEHFAVYFSEDLNYWAFVVDQWTGNEPFTIHARYIASTSESDSTEDIKKYFGGWLRLE